MCFKLAHFIGLLEYYMKSHIHLNIVLVPNKIFVLGYSRMNIQAKYMSL